MKQYYHGVLKYVLWDMLGMLISYHQLILSFALFLPLNAYNRQNVNRIKNAAQLLPKLFKCIDENRINTARHL